MANIKHKKITVKRKNGDVEDTIVAYMDVTHKVKSIMGNDVIGAVLLIEEYCEGLNITVDEWIERLNVLPEGENYLDIKAGDSLCVLFRNGNTIEINTSQVSRVKKLPCFIVNYLLFDKQEG